MDSTDTGRVVDAGTLCPRLPAAAGEDMAWDALSTLWSERERELGDTADFDTAYKRFTHQYAALARRSGWLGYMAAQLVATLLSTELVHLEAATGLDEDDALAMLSELVRGHVLAAVGTLITQAQYIPTDDMFFSEQFAARRRVTFPLPAAD